MPWPACVLGKSTWAVLGLTCYIELFTQKHYRESIADESRPFAAVEGRLPVSLEGGIPARDARRARVAARGREAHAGRERRAVDDLIALVAAVDGILQVQSIADVAYFTLIAGRTFNAEQRRALDNGVLKAYRWQYIGSGVQHPHFQKVLGGLINSQQAERIGAALAPILQ